MSQRPLVIEDISSLFTTLALPFESVDAVVACRYMGFETDVGLEAVRFWNENYRQCPLTPETESVPVALPDERPGGVFGYYVPIDSRWLYVAVKEPEA